jgi:hypothetical protein
MRVRIKSDEMLDDNHKSLFQRIESVMELRRNSGHRILSMALFERSSKFGVILFWEIDEHVVTGR